MKPRIGSLFSGYAGLDSAVAEVFDAETVWFSEVEPAPSKILAHHFPDVPNHGDITLIDWATVEPVDILTGGFPCQDVSLAGARAGLKEGTRSGLWSYFAAAIDALRPQLVVIENVRGLLSATTLEEIDATDSDLEWAEGGVGVPVGVDRPVLNAFGRVLGDLAVLGYDAEWCGVRASDAGAPHGRFRIFILAYPNDGTGNGQRSRPQSWEGSETAPDTASVRRYGGKQSALAGTPLRRSGDSTRTNIAAHSSGDGLGEHTERDRKPERPELEASQRPHTDRRSTTDPDNSGRSQHGGGIPIRTQQPPIEHARADVAWGVYGPAIRRWEAVLGRPAPSPTNPDGRDGQHRLAAEFVEWLMGCDQGWVTDPAIGLTRNQMLKALGNGVVKQQAALALGILNQRRLARIKVAA